MRWRLGNLTLVFLGLVIVGVAASWALSDPGESQLEESTVADVDIASYPAGPLGGQTAPEVSFPLFEGSTFVMSDHVANDGRPIVLNFWASWCFPCRAEMPEFSALSEANPGVAFIGVAIDDTFNAASDFADEVGVVYPLGFDEDDAVATAYPAVGLPTTYLIDSGGIVTHRIQGQISGPVLQAFIDHDFGG